MKFLIEQVEAAPTVKEGVAILLSGLASRLAQAVANVNVHGASAQQVADAVTAGFATIKASTVALGDAVLANTPSASTSAAATTP